MILTLLTLGNLGQEYAEAGQASLNPIVRQPGKELGWEGEKNEEFMDKYDEWWDWYRFEENLRSSVFIEKG